MCAGAGVAHSFIVALTAATDGEVGRSVGRETMTNGTRNIKEIKKDPASVVHGF